MSTGLCGRVNWRLTYLFPEKLGTDSFTRVARGAPGSYSVWKRRNPPLLSNYHEPPRCCWKRLVTWRWETDKVKITANNISLRAENDQTQLEKQMTYWSSLKYVKPTNGNWFPTKAFGVGNDSTSPLSSSISSKLLVSMSLLSSGTTGATAEEERERKENGRCELLNSFWSWRKKGIFNWLRNCVDTYCLWWCQRSTGRSWRKGDAWFHPRRFCPVAPPLKQRQWMSCWAMFTV